MIVGAAALMRQPLLNCVVFFYFAELMPVSLRTCRLPRPQSSYSDYITGEEKGILVPSVKQIDRSSGQLRNHDEYPKPSLLRTSF